MSLVKLDFLNWRPDQQDFRHDGLAGPSGANNVYHAPEGWVPFKSSTTSNFTVGAGNTALATTPSLVIKSVGTADQRIVAYLHNGVTAGAGFTIDMSIGIFSDGFTTIGQYTTYTSSTITSAYTGNNISAFQVCELDDKIFFTAQAELPATTALNASAPVITLNSTGYATI